MSKDPRRIYYDHEPAYKKIAARRGRGWDDLTPTEVQGSYDAFLRFLDSALMPAPGARVHVLDMGCGGGQVALMLAERGYTACGVDYSETAIDLAQRNAQAAGLTIHFSVGDCLGLDGFDDGAMDVVVDNHLLHCLIGPQDRLSFLRSAYRALKPGGILFSDTGSCEGDFDPLVVEADPETRVARNHTRCWVSQAELNRELQATGWQVTHQEVRANEPWGSMIVTYAQRPGAPPSPRP